MDVAAKVGTITMRVLHTLIDTIMLIIFLMALAFGCYAIWDSNQIHSTASADTYIKYKPAAENAFNSFESLRNINHEVFAWLTVYGTNIDYPMAQGENNMKYVNTSAEGKHSLSGAIFADYRNSTDFTDFNSIIYGHNMDSSAMFSDISKFSDKAYFDNHRYGKLFYDGQELGIEFFAFVRTGENDRQVFNPNITSPDAKQEYLEILTEKAVNIREDVSVNIDDRIILLSTCSPNTTGGRDILVGKLTDTVPENIFETEQAVSPRIISTIDELQNFWSQTALWLRIATLMSAISLVALVILLMRDRRRGKGITKEVKYNVH